MPLPIPLKHFSAEEFTMDGQDVSHHMNADFLLKLDTCREQAGVPFSITSSYRSPDKNKRVGGSYKSMHLQGRAVDISCPDSATRYKIVRAALLLGLSVGIMPTAIHIDNRENQVVFHYYAKYQPGNSVDE